MDQSVGRLITIIIILSVQVTQDSGEGPLPFGMRIMLVGKTGSGKSAAGNTILGRDVFEERFSPTAVTFKFETHSGDVTGRKISVTDTPGIFSIDPSDEEVKREMIEARNHFFLLVIRLGKFTREERNTLKWIQDHFGEHALQYSMVLFTGGDQLNAPVEQFLKESSGLQELVSSCGGGYHVINNKDRSNHIQVTELLEKMEAVLLNMAGYHQVSGIIQQVQKREEIQAALIVMLVAAVGFLRCKIQKIQAEGKRKRKELERTIRAEEEIKRDELERTIREEKRKRDELERMIREEMETKRDKLEKTSREEEEGKRDELERTIRADKENER